MQKTFTQKFVRDLLTVAAQAAAGVAGDLNGAKVHLYTAGPTVNHHMVPGDFTEPTFTGYAAAVITWSVPINAGDLAGVLVGTDAVFRPTATTALPQTILGAYVTDSTSAIVLWAEPFDSPVILIDTADAVVYDTDFVLPFVDSIGP